MPVQKFQSVKDYLASLPDDRRAAIEAVRRVILKHLDKDYEEGIQYNMIGYYVPHSVYPAGYHCDPKQPLPFAALASQKNYMSLYMMCLYACDGDKPSGFQKWFRDAWSKSGKKLDMGKACIRFKSLDDIPLEVIGEAVARVPAKTYIARVKNAFSTRSARRPAPKKKTAAKKR